MSLPEITLLNDPKLLAMREQHLLRLEALYAGERLEQPFFLSSIGGSSTCTPDNDAAAWVSEALASLARVVASSCDLRVFRPLVIEYWYYGVHFVDAVLGATVIPTTQEGAGGWWTTCLSSPVGSLEPPNLNNNLPWQLAQTLALAMRDCGAPLPFFAPQVLSSPLNIAINLYGEEFLIALALEPDAARHDLRIITDTIKSLTHWFQQTLPPLQFQSVWASGRCQPRGFGQLCGCSTQLLSATQYHEFIAPLDAEVLACYPRGGMMHLCGTHTQHLPTWRDMPGLRAVQLNDRAAEDFSTYFAQLRDDQIIYLLPTDGMTVERALEISAGRRLVLLTG